MVKEQGWGLQWQCVSVLQHQVALDSLLTAVKKEQYQWMMRPVTKAESVLLI